jgi:hypothetical protein
MVSAKSEQQKTNLLKQRSRKETKVLGSVKRKKEMNAFNKKWKTKK